MRKHLILLITILTVSVNGQNKLFNQLANKRVASGNTINWKQVGPGNAGFANLLRYHPTIPGKVALCPDMWNVYQSENNGKDWYGVTDFDGDASFYHLRDLEYSISNPEFALAIASSELWSSKNGGKNWQLVKNCPWYKPEIDGSDKDGWRKKVAALNIDPTNENIWFVAGGENVRGQDWLSSYKDVTSANPRGKKAQFEGEIWRTKNAGKSWKLVNIGLNPKAQIGRIIVNPKNSKQVFVASNYGVYRSDNGGNSWEQITKGQLDNNIIMDMDYYYNSESGKFILYLIDQVHYIPNDKTTKCSGGIYISSNEGKTWQKINGDLGLDINRLTGGVPKNYYNYISKWLGVPVWKAKSMYPQLPTKALQYFNMLSTDPSREGALYIGFSDPQIGNSIMPGRVWTTSNNGKKWINTARLYEETWAKDKDYWAERGNPYHQNMKVGHSSPHMRFGKDYALRSTRGLDVGVDGSVMMISDHSTMLSTDHGKTWQQMDEDYTPSGAIIGHGNSNLPGLIIKQDKRFETTLLGSGEHELWIPANDSPDDRIALKYIGSTQPTVSNLVFDPYNAKIVYATSNRQENKQNIFRSTDGGLNWENYGVATPATNKWLDDFYTNGLIIDPINNENLYFGISIIENRSKAKMGGFYYSDDYGKTFSTRNYGLPLPLRVNDVKFDPRDKRMESLFIAAEKHTINYHGPIAEGGMYYSSNRGLLWEKVNLPPSIKGVNFISFDHTNRMYITTGFRQGGSGVWYSDDFGEKWHQIFKYPGAQCIDISPYDNNLLVVTVEHMSKNPGVYISRDRGETWEKNNENITIPHKIEDVKFDIHNPGEMWIATLGCGFYKGKIKYGDKIQVVDISKNTVELNKGEKIQLTASIINSNFSDEKLIWKSENPAIVKVSTNGELTAVSNGLTKVWVTTKNGRFADFSVVTVKK
ncbi:Ig-like domain-containing protein [Lutibacter sp. TH_r2]|uniref:VPS10 domain-containing protein n=1 Tax=Lutibacter sp. TH_r2 TaxID=3082083 RepID=UPI00295596FC|nr:Ig-like domain-containing protein [Lutibacter sp. TH_r2]MDV7185906.1 Ig-like domain-containing protein [Lutibacter sp. TH_r2]